MTESSQWPGVSTEPVSSQNAKTRPMSLSCPMRRRTEPQGHRRLRFSLSVSTCQRAKALVKRAPGPPHRGRPSGGRALKRRPVDEPYLANPDSNVNSNRQENQRPFPYSDAQTEKRQSNPVRRNLKVAALHTRWTQKDQRRSQEKPEEPQSIPDISSRNIGS